MKLSDLQSRLKLRKEMKEMENKSPQEFWDFVSNQFKEKGTKLDKTCEKCGSTEVYDAWVGYICLDCGQMVWDVLGGIGLIPPEDLSPEWRNDHLEGNCQRTNEEITRLGYPPFKFPPYRNPWADKKENDMTNPQEVYDYLDELKKSHEADEKLEKMRDESAYL